MTRKSKIQTSEKVLKNWAGPYPPHFSGKRPLDDDDDPNFANLNLILQVIRKTSEWQHIRKIALWQLRDRSRTVGKFLKYSAMHKLSIIQSAKHRLKRPAIIQNHLQSFTLKSFVAILGKLSSGQTHCCSSRVAELAPLLRPWGESQW